MKRILTILTLAVAACIDTPAGLNDHIEDRTVGEEVAFVDCDPIAYDISDGTNGSCKAMNADSSLVDPTFAIWTSSVPAAVLVSTFGDTEVGTVASASVVITACGPNGACADSQTLSTVP